MPVALADPIQLRCRSKLQGIVKFKANGMKVLEVRCKDKFCADRRAGEVVLHEFDLESGKLVRTKRYRDPISVLKKKGDEQ